MFSNLSRWLANLYPTMEEDTNSSSACVEGTLSHNYLPLFLSVLSCIFFYFVYISKRLPGNSFNMNSRQCFSSLFSYLTFSSSFGPRRIFATISDNMKILL